MSDSGGGVASEKAPAAHHFLSGASEMAALVRSKDWSQTPLGPIEIWPQSLRTTVSLCLSSNFPINIIWGPQNTQIYNDGYRVVCGAAHPQALGEGYDVTWASAWPAIGAPFEQACSGETSFLENQRMFLTRNGYFEETFFTFSLSPIRDESGGIGGVFHPVTETTATILSERRTRALRELTARLGAAADLDALVDAVISTLAPFEYDLPFLLIYGISDDGTAYELKAAHGVQEDTGLSPQRIDLAASKPWPFNELSGRPTAMEVAGVAELCGDARCGPYDESPNKAFVLPISVSGVAVPPLVVVAGASSRLPLDDVYRGFYELLAATVSAALTTVRAREDERRRAEALAEVDRAKTQFFSNVSHEFRTPLTLMLGPLQETLLRSGTLVEADRQQLEVAERNGQRLLRLVNVLLDFSRIEAGRTKAAFEPTDLAAFTAELASNFRSATDRAGLTLLIDAEPLGAPAYVDREMWEKIVLNLVSNAFKFTLDGEIEVALRATGDGKSAQLIVRDTGAGIPADALPHLFERFYRVEGATGRSFEGSGIGLALVRELVAMHGGDIIATSEVGLGTTFTVTFPLGSNHLAPGSAQTDQAAAPRPARTEAFVDEALGWLPDEPNEAGRALGSPTSRQASAGRILLADDNADMRGYLRRLLASEGFHVESYADGEAALAAARHEAPDLILSDVMMPKMDGFQLLAALRADEGLAAIPLILLSARAGEEARVEGLKAGADDYLTKPFSARELIARVSVNISQARDRREAALRALNADLERQVAERTIARGRTWQLSPDLMGVVNAEGYFEVSNPAWQTVLGWSEAEIAKLRFFDFIHPDDLARTQDAWTAAIERGEPAMRFENRYRRRDGEWRWLSWVSIPEDGKVYCTARDITEEKAKASALVSTEEALRQAQKMEAVGQLTGGIAHDFNNMLAGISGSLELLDKRLSEGRYVGLERYISTAQESARRAASLTQRLLAFARRQTLDPRAVDANRMIANMADLLQRSVGPDVKIEVVQAGGLWATKIDPPQLENALLNLCINARDAMAPAGGTITIETANKWLDDRAAKERELPPGQYVSICVSDTGTGMGPDVIAKAFDPFFTTKPQGQGTGLGLSMIYGFVRQSGGQVRVYSEIGQGTTMCLYLPRYLGEAAEESLVEEERIDSGDGETVLIIDDEPAIRMLVTETLIDSGYRVLEADDGAKGLKILQSGARIDLLVSDVGLPGGLNGRQVADAARVTRPDLKVLFITGFAENAAVGAGHLAAGMSVITKPFAMTSLANKVRELIDGA